MALMVEIFVYFVAVIAAVTDANVLYPTATPIQLGKLYKDRVHHEEPKSFTFAFNMTHNVIPEGATIRLYANSPMAKPEFPVQVALKFRTRTYSMNLPQTVDGADYQYFNHTVCPDLLMQNLYNKTKWDPLIIEVSTASMIYVKFNLEIDLQRDYVLDTDTKYHIRFHPSTPFNYRLPIPEGYEYVVLHLTSPDDQCMTLSTQDGNCTNSKGGMVEVMSADRAGGITLSRDRHPSGQVAIRISLNANDSRCEPEDSDLHRSVRGKRRKTVDFTVKPSLTDKQFRAAIGWVLGVVLAAYAITTVGFGVVFKMTGGVGASNANSYNRLGEGPSNEAEPSAPVYAPEEPPRPHENEHGASGGSGEVVPYGAGRDSPADEPILPPKGPTSRGIPPQVGPSSAASSSAPPPIPADPVFNVEPAHSTATAQTTSFVPQILAAGVIYAIPVYQLIETTIELTHSTGDNDVCFYNSLCSHYGYGINDLNHVFSNVAYVGLGVLYIAIVMVKNALAGKTPTDFSTHHRFNNFYHALGTALTLEGVMSAMYHMCPTTHNLQFDLAFIYVALLLILMKNMAAKGSLKSANFGLSIALMSTVATTFAGLFFDHKAGMTAIVALAVLFAAPLISYGTFYGGEWTHFDLPRNIKLSVPATVSCKKSVGSTLANFAITGAGIACIYSEFLVTDYVTLILIVLAMNVASTTTYIYLKQIKEYFPASHNTSLTKPLTSAACAVFGFVVGAASLVLFAEKTYDPTLTAAASRHLNAECILLHFYDAHDLWHLTSAFAAFFLFLAMLFLDEAVAERMAALRGGHTQPQPSASAHSQEVDVDEADFVA